MKNKPHGLLYISGLFGLFAVWVSGIATLEDTTQKIWVSILILGISSLFAMQDVFRHMRHGNAIRIAIQTVLAGCLFFIRPGWSVFPIVFFILSPQAMMDFPIKIGLAWLALFSVITIFGVFAGGGFSELVSILPYTAGYLFFGLFGWTMTLVDRERQRSDRLLADLQIAHEKLRRYTEQVEELTIAEERNRIAREMHDTLGHRLTIAAVQLEGAQRLINSNPNKVDQIVKTVYEQVKDGLTELRRTVAIMRAPVADDLPLAQALSRLVHQVNEATGIPIHLGLPEKMSEIPANYRHALFRAAQEGLTNIERHSGANEAWITLEAGDAWIRITIEDNGVGLKPDLKNEGLGLTGMRERAGLLQGYVDIQPRDGGGTRLVFHIPITRGD